MLRCFYPPRPAPGTGTGTIHEVNVIVIPGLTAAPPSEWHDQSGKWLERLVDNCGARAQIWAYESKRDPGNNSVVQQLVEEGRDLLTCLQNLCSGKGTDSPTQQPDFRAQQARRTHSPRRRPLLFICHSLGGIILKCALSLTKNHVFRHLDVIEVIYGIVFLGTPHLPLNAAPSPNIIDLILRLHQRTSPQKHALTVNDNAFLARCCQDFELLDIQLPIVSAYETVESRVHQGMFKTQRVIIASKERSIIKSQHEIVVATDKTHDDICNVQVGGSLYKAIDYALQRSLEYAPGLIFKKFHTSTLDGGDVCTIRSLTTDNERTQPVLIAATKSMEISTMSSRGATLGSSLNPSQSTDHATTNFDVVKKDPKLPWLSMKAHKRKADFFGRQDILDLIDKNLLPENRRNVTFNEGSLRSFALCGMGGIGKTQIAVEYAYSRMSKYDAIFFITADGKTVLSEEFARVAVQLGLEDQSEANDITVSCEIVKGWLSNPVKHYNKPPSPENEASWLLIFDNVDDLDVLEDFWPTTGSGAVLLTSRDSLAKNQIYTANNGIDLQPFSVEDAIQFLKTLSRRPLQPTQEKYAAELADRLGGLPLLITQMAGVMARLRLSYSEFIDLYNASGIEQISMTGTSRSTPQQVYSISYKLGFDGLAPTSFGLLSLIAMLDPDRIPETILTCACSKDSKISLEHFPNTLQQYYEARAQLLQTSLINQNSETGDIWVHRIVQDVTKGKLLQHRLIDIYNLAIFAVSAVWPFSTLETRFHTARYKYCVLIFPTIVRLRDAYKHVASYETLRQDLAAATLFSDAGWYRFERGFQEESKEWFELVQQICDGLEDKSSEEVKYMIRDTHHNLGTASGETNDTGRFLKHSGIWLEMLLERKTPDGELVVDYELGMGYNEHGNSQAMHGRWEVASWHFSKAIETFQKLSHYVETMMGWPAANKGLMHWILGDFEAAERTFTEIIDVFRSANGVDDILSFKTGKMLYGLGNVYVSQGQFEKGLEYHIRCLKQYRATLGDRHHRIGDICHRLADDNLRFKNYAEAQVLINQALKVFSGRQQYRQELARSTYKASQVSFGSGNTSKAASELQDAFRLRQTIVPDDDRGMDELTEEDYDNLVVFWSR